MLHMFGDYSNGQLISNRRSSSRGVNVKAAESPWIGKVSFSTTTSVPKAYICRRSIKIDHRAVTTHRFIELIGRISCISQISVGLG